MKFATKLQLGRRMLERAFAAGIPAKWVTGDIVYGNDWRMRSWLDERRQAHRLAGSEQYRIFTGEQQQWAKQVVAELPAES